MKSNLLKKIICCISALAIALIVPDVSDEKISAVDSAITYYSYNAKTGEFLNEYTLNPLGVIGATQNSRSAGIDDRVLDWTKQGVVKIIFGNSEGTGIGTGFVVSEHVIATAAHCVYGNSINKIMIFNGNSDDYIELTPVEYHLSKKFSEEYPISKDFGNSGRQDAERESRCCDYALITVKEDLTDYMCFNLGVATDTAIENAVAITVTGFPGDVRNNKVNTIDLNNMYSCTGLLVDMEEHINNCESAEYCYLNMYKYLQNEELVLCNNAYTTSGNSGGPMYVTESYNGDVYYTVIGIQTSGVDTKTEMATRITTDLLHFYLNNENLNW